MRLYCMLSILNEFEGFVNLNMHAIKLLDLICYKCDN